MNFLPLRHENDTDAPSQRRAICLKGKSIITPRTHCWLANLSREHAITSKDVTVLNSRREETTRQTYLSRLLLASRQQFLKRLVSALIGVSRSFEISVTDLQHCWENKNSMFKVENRSSGLGFTSVNRSQNGAFSCQCFV